jgi:hypothetical protein
MDTQEESETDSKPNDDAEDRPLSELGVGDGREKHVHLVTESGTEIDHEEVHIRHTETEYLVSPDTEFSPAETTRYRKENIGRVKITQHHSNCFITTATAGEGPTLDSLRDFRADVMRPSPAGRALLRVYEATSPPIARTLDRHPEAAPTRLVRGLVDRCGSLADRRRAATGSGERAVLSLALVAMYAVGVCLGALAHGWLRARERRTS